MHSLLHWFMRNPVAANLLMALILVTGGLSLWNIRIEGFPRIPPDTVSVTITVPGLSAGEIDHSVTRLVERQLEGLQGVRNVSSFSLDGQSVVSVKKSDGTDISRLVDDVKERIDGLAHLPSNAERARVEKADASFAAMIVQVYGEVDQKELQRSARIIKQRLLARPEIGKIDQWGERPVEISIEVASETLRAIDMTLEDVAAVVTQGSSVQRDGELDTAGGNIRIRASQRSRDVGEFAAIPVATGQTGAAVRLSDIATIDARFGDDDVHVRFNGLPAIGFEVSIDSSGNLLDIDRAVAEVLAGSGDVLSDRIRADVWANQTGFVTERLKTLQQNAWQGLLLVFLVLACFLSVRLAFWVAVGIPVSLAGTVAVMTASGLAYSLNDITTFGMIIVLGVLVDDAVVIGESVFTAQREHSDPVVATGVGVERVATATVFGALTTMAAFVPMTTFDDPLGKVFGSFAVVVIIALSFSLLESKFILPSHLASHRPARQARDKKRSRMSVWTAAVPLFFDRQLQRFVRRIYRPTLEFCLVFRWQTLVLFVAIAWATYGLVAAGQVRTVFFPAIPGSVISVNMEFDSRMSQARTLNSARHLHETAHALNAELIATHDLSTPPISKLMTAVVGSSNAELYAELSPAADRPLDALQIADLWRTRAGMPEGAIKMEFVGGETTSDGFEIELYADNHEQLEEVVAAATGALHDINGVSDVRSNLDSGQAELSIKLNGRGVALGLDAESLLRQVSNAFGGLEIQRHQSDEDEIRVFVRYPEEQRTHLADLLDDHVRLPDGAWVPLRSIADIESRYVARWLWRKNLQHAATISAFVDKSRVSSPEVYGRLATGALAPYVDADSDVRLVPAGEIAQQGEMSEKLWRALILASLIIYGLLAVPLRSYFQPFLILSVVPFGFVGAAVGHYLMDIPFSVLSFFGMLALTGIVVNDSLLLVNGYNAAVEAGDANPIISSTVARFRPVLLTTVTTVAGLLPLLLQTSEQALYLIPAVVSLVFGELFATFITLLLVPVLLAIFHPARSRACSSMPD